MIREWGRSRGGSRSASTRSRAAAATHDARRTTHALVLMRRCAGRIRVCGLDRIARGFGAVGAHVVVLLAGRVLVPTRAILDLSLERGRWNSGGVIEHEPPAEHARPK